MSRLFTAAQLEAHTARPARWWHTIRRVVAPFAAWRTVADEVTFVGTLVKGTTDPDGDTNFQLYVLPFLTLHCEVDPDDLDRLRPILLTLNVGQRASVSGTLRVDLGHGSGAVGSQCQLEIHPVAGIITLTGLEPAA